MASKRVRFLESRTVRDWRVGTPDEERFEAGKIYDLPASSADHWISRGAAEEAPAAKPKGKPRGKSAKADAESGADSSAGE